MIPYSEKTKTNAKKKTYIHNVPNTDPKAKQKTSKHAYYQKKRPTHSKR
jgi:hypothetical protein